MPDSGTIIFGGLLLFFPACIAYEAIHSTIKDIFYRKLSRKQELEAAKNALITKLTTLYANENYNEQLESVYMQEITRIDNELGFDSSYTKVIKCIQCQKHGRVTYDQNIIKETYICSDCTAAPVLEWHAKNSFEAIRAQSEKI